jgi:ATP/maltotriose-dependent transcriptional regulator MalT
VVAFATAGFVALVAARGAAYVRSTATLAGRLPQAVAATPYAVGIGLALAMVASGAPDSPLLPLAVASAWEAGRRSQSSAALHATLFAVAYLAAAALDGLSAPEPQPQLVMETVKTIGLVGLGAAVGAAFARRQHEVAAMAFVLERSAEERADVRVKLARALRNEPLPVDSLVAGAHLGLTVRETELLGFLLMGLTNQEIADGACVSEATVKYRLTRLYKKLGVARRPHAVRLARELGFGPADLPQ